MVRAALVTKGEHSEIDEAIWHGDGRLSLRRCLGTSVISEVVIGMGASLGREAAPSCWAVPRRAFWPPDPAALQGQADLAYEDSRPGHGK
jgi:hypothetical protein